ncbi:MAG: YtxH domain-containing protein [Desulfosporosinus sp.]|nr:YtxH domain-containing protein [Desulfosporosinus sp.]
MLRMHKSQQNTNLSTIAVAALVGGLAGAVVGLMIAPKSGKELRQGLCKKSGNARERVGDVTSHRVGALKQQGTDLVDKGKHLAEDLQSFIQESLKIRKSSPIALNTDNDIQVEEPLQDQPEMALEVNTEIPPQEEE